MRREQVDRLHVGRSAGLGPDRSHEVERVFEPVDDRLEAFQQLRVADVRQRPCPRVIEVGEARRQERTDAVEGRRRVEVGGEQSLRIRIAVVRIERVDLGVQQSRVAQTDVVAAKARHRPPVRQRLRIARPRLRVLPRYPRDPHDRHPCAVDEHERHEQEQTEARLDRPLRAVREGLRAVAALYCTCQTHRSCPRTDEGLAGRDIGELGAQTLNLRRCDEARQAPQLGEDSRQLLLQLLAVPRDLERRFRAVRIWRPVGRGAVGRGRHCAIARSPSECERARRKQTRRHGAHILAVASPAGRRDGKHWSVSHCNPEIGHDEQDKHDQMRRPRDSAVARPQRLRADGQASSP